MRKSPPTKPSSATTPRAAAALLGLSRAELDELGEELFEKLLAEAFERELARRMTGFNAAMDAAKLLIAEGRIDTGLGLLQSAAVALGQDGIQHSDISRRFARMLFGSRSERLDREQLALLFAGLDGEKAQFDAAADKGEVPVVPTTPPPSEDADADDAEPSGNDDAEVAGAIKTAKKRRPGHHGRRPLASTLEPVEGERAIVPEAERACGVCGKEMRCIRHDKHQRLEWVPAKLVLFEDVSEVLACPLGHGDIINASRSPLHASRRRIGNSVVADLIVEKCSEAQPLHRERLRYGRLGWDAPPSTIDSVWRWGTTLLTKVADVFRGEVLAREYIQADSTPLTILDPKHPKHRFKGQVWAFVAGGDVVFDFAKDWSASSIADSFLVNPVGHKQVDDYAGYGREIEHGGKKVRLVLPDRRLGCGMHIRRRFFDALEAKEMRAAPPLQLIQQLYAIEADAKTRGLTEDERLALRKESSLPVLGELRQWLDRHVGKLPPQSSLGRAVAYADQQWDFFARCFTRGDFEIDNGECERQIRQIAIGRRNFLFSGSVDAADRLCAAYTLVIGAKRKKLDPFMYIRDLLDKLERGWPVDRISELTPSRWVR